MVELLDTVQAAAYWDGRHGDSPGLRSGGHIGLTLAGNETFYAIRLGQLLAVLGDLDAVDAPLQLLDAGCGKGFFSRALARSGYVVDAVDASPAAVAECRALGGGPRYAVSALAAWRSPALYDAVVAVDVLFHVLDDAEWAATVVRLASLVGYGGRLVVSDHARPGRRQLGSYILHRPQSDYAALLEPRGLQYAGFQPYGFRDSDVGFLRWTRSR